ncbi:MAG: hypothetical protein HOP29_10640 [Phycisphaerales bacterium]|nr:hypothetical protein [Phycisphaerales bacterium]
MPRPLPGCPHCGGPVGEVQTCEQFIEDLPPTRPQVTRLVTYVGRCRHCGEVRSTHPMQVSIATCHQRGQDLVTVLRPDLVLPTPLPARQSRTRKGWGTSHEPHVPAVGPRCAKLPDRSS